MTETPPSHASRTRRLLSLVLIVLAGPVALFGATLLYVREEIVDSRAFADRAADTLRMPAVSHVAAKEFAAQVVEPAVPDAIAARPLVIDGMDRLIRTDAFSPVLRTAAEHAHRLLFERGSNAVFDVADAGAVVTSALQTLAPKLAKELPKHAETILLTIRRRSFAGQTLLLRRPRALVRSRAPSGRDRVARGRDRDRAGPAPRDHVRRGRRRCGRSVTRARPPRRPPLRRHATCTARRNSPTPMSAGRSGGIWTGMFGDLMTWALWVGGVAWLIAAASASLLSAYSAGTGVEQLRALARKPLSPRARGARAVIVLAIGLFAVLKPRTVINVVVVLVGAALIYAAIGELLSVTAPAEPRSRPSRRRVLRRVATVAGALATAVVAFVLALLVTGGARSSQASTIMACNGYPQLCARRLDEVVFAGTHNSMSAADSHGLAHREPGPRHHPAT